MTTPNALPGMQRIPARLGDVGGLTIRRALPTDRRRMVGAWCFLDHAGPADLPPQAPMRVAPHPHTGLQTFSWMIEGEILHRDSLDCVQLLRPGQVNLMTAGRGIAHSEESQTARLQLAQLWIALPEADRFCEPRFEHFPELPRAALGGFSATVLVGRQGAARSPVPTATPLLGMDLSCAVAATAQFGLDPAFEHGLMALEGELAVTPAGAGAEAIIPGELLYLPPGCGSLSLESRGPARLLLLGGPPFGEDVLLWWNFVGRSVAEIERYAADWNARRAFGEVRGYDGERLVAPDTAALRQRESAARPAP